MGRREAQNLKSMGFTLVEIMIVVAIIGLLVTLAKPKFANFIANARSTDAKIQLRQIGTLQTSYYNEHNRYSTDPGAIGFSSNSKIYTELIIQNSLPGQPSSDQVYCAWVWTKPGVLLCPSISQDAWTICYNGNGQFARCAHGRHGSACFTDNPTAYPGSSTPLSGFNALCFE